MTSYLAFLTCSVSSPCDASRTGLQECGIDIIWTNRSILFSSPEKNLSYMLWRSLDIDIHMALTSSGQVLSKLKR
jgi:hypothetical protein